ncbi:outer membrane beta-barrel protein [uncultured Pontibacter sp.]|uniref:outer membrane beta-barrel protein n=1 Tax=uncultured Pontibacter sp. TaxID=453356 RepID=UPI00261D1E22|nr:outer membrane beta-barrel protein [uncultured Pontibacter sp.]
MKQTLLTALLCCLFTATTWAQAPFSGTIKGSVIDSTNSQGLGYVTVLIQEVGQNQPLKSTFTKDNGYFEVAGLPEKNYEVILTYVGYRTQVIKVPAFAPGKTTADLGKILMVSTANKLKEVEVVTEKLLITQDVDKLSYNVDADPESKTMNALDMLRKVPLLSVDGDDNIKLNGNSNYKVLINGKESSLFANSPKDVFKSMPANSIKNIEVITNPPSKYEAEGVGGIINIITHKKAPGGYNGSVSGNIRSPRGSYGGGYLTAKVGKFGASVYGGLSDYYSPKSSNNYTREDFIYQTILDQQGHSTNEGKFRYLSGELSFELDTLNLFTANFNMNQSNGGYEQEQLVKNNQTDGTPISSYRRLNLGDQAWFGNEVGLDYQRTFKRSKEQLLTLSYKYGQNGNESFTDFSLIPLLSYPGSKNKTENNGATTEQTFQIDYVQPVKKHALEVGVKTILRDINSDFYYQTFDAEQNRYITDASRTNNFEYNQDIYAAYTSMNLKKDKWGLRVGARLEETKVDANFKSTGTLTDQDYFNLIPNIALSRSLPKMSNIKLSYTQRIERPSLWYINPYVNEVDPKNISYGNENLKAATSNVFNLSYNTFVKGVSINTGISHTFTNSSIQQYTFLRSIDTVSVTTFGNIGKNHTTGINLSTNATFLKKITLNLNGAVNYVQLQSTLNDRPVDNDGITANIYGNLSYKFEKGWRASGNIGVYSSDVLLQGRSASYMFNSLSATKQFLKDNKASVTLSLSSPFQKTRRWFTEIDEPGRFRSEQESYFVNRRLTMSFNYRFGKLKGDIARKKRGIKNDDLKGGGDSSGGGTSN